VASANWSIYNDERWTCVETGDRCARRVGCSPMKILYKPFAIVAGIIGVRIGRSAFKSLWSRIDGGEPPSPTSAEVSTGKAVGAAALEAATLAAAGAVAERMSAKFFHHLTGFWPEKPAKAEDSEAPKQLTAGSKS
jgi:hypothetical protein